MDVRFTAVLAGLALGGCTITKTVYVTETGGEENSPTEPTEPTEPGPDYTSGGLEVGGDEDGDGVSNGDEEALGTDPNEGDSDGDGFLDGEELDAGTNPSNGYSHEYEGGYNVGNCDALPEDAGPSGVNGYGFQVYNEGDTVANFTLTDQYGQDVDLYSFCGQTIMLTFSAMWCGPCQDAASQMQGEQDEFGPDGFQAIEFLIEDFSYGSGTVADDDLEYWADWFGLESVPVLGDPAGSVNAEWYHWEADWGIPTFVFIGPDLTVLAVDTYSTDPASWM